MLGDPSEVGPEDAGKFQFFNPTKFFSCFVGNSGILIKPSFDEVGGRPNVYYVYHEN